MLLDRRGFLARLGAASARVGAGLGPARGQGAAIWQRIWDADQGERGIPAILADQRGDPPTGFVRVDERESAPPGHRLFSEVVIPEKKRLTYDLCRALFDNYRLDQTKPEETTPLEAQEMLALLDAITDSAPMQLACAHVEEQLGRPCARDAWRTHQCRNWCR
jgi:poly(U)-specific endoribonuclease